MCAAANVSRKTGPSSGAKSAREQSSRGVKSRSAKKAESRRLQKQERVKGKRAERNTDRGFNIRSINKKIFNLVTKDPDLHVALLTLLPLLLSLSVEWLISSSCSHAALRYLQNDRTQKHGDHCIPLAVCGLYHFLGENARVRKFLL